MAKAKAKPRPREHWSSLLVALGACTPGLRWARRQPSLREAWRTCRNGAWMYWLTDEVWDWSSERARAVEDAFYNAPGVAKAAAIRKVEPRGPSMTDLRTTIRKNAENVGLEWE